MRLSKTVCQRDRPRRRVGTKRSPLSIICAIPTLITFLPCCCGFASSLAHRQAWGGRDLIQPYSDQASGIARSSNSACRPYRLFHNAPQNSKRRRSPTTAFSTHNNPKTTQSSSGDPLNEQVTSSSPLAKYHLLWSPRVWQKIGLTTLSLWITNRSVPWDMLHIPLPNLLFTNALLPTLASACCWVQLILNMVVPMLGCAGFNTYLGPLRPFFLSLLLYLTWATRLRTPLTAIMIRWTIALLPELLHLWNAKRQETRNKNNDQGEETMAMMRTVSITLNCPTMGCVACINKVNSSFQNAKIPASPTPSTTTTTTPTIHSAQSWLLDGKDQKGGQAKIELSLPIPPPPANGSPSSSNQKEENTAGVDPEILSAVVHMVENIGFPCTIDHAQVN